VRELIRAHRLWEHYMVKREGMPLEAVHAEAHRREHETSFEEVERLLLPLLMANAITFLIYQGGRLMGF
jgi:Mn-dependent DtxR family transcriptional regulator